jgi:molecular chaperone GrpE
MEKKDKKSGDLEQNLKKCEEERDEYLNGWKRAKADFINYKKEEAERFREFAKISNEALISELLVVLDSFNLGLTVLEKGNPAEKGMRLIKSQLEDTLKKYGLERIAAKPGDEFDPNRHEGLGEVESNEKSGSIAEVVEVGYTLNGRVIRPAKVQVSKGQTT